MEKISKIIPSNARTRQTDVAGSQAVRPGAPTIGKVVEDRVSLSKATLPQGPNGLMTYKPPTDSARVRIAEDVANRFFGQSPKEVARDSDLAASEQFTETLAEA
ncbi:MAG: hypothetical protein JNM39_02595 [Bdellovibrionaceae bacterium]|jgi:hypothetical protein|nr:hypothetical protein [Pseudobdellovibrionaceae bacterium]